MKYFTFETNSDYAISEWEQSQYDLCDVVLSLTDRKIFYGAKIYAVFCRKEVLNLLQYFICDFERMKEDLGIVGDYVERCGNVFLENFNPKRNHKAITINVKDLEKLAKKVYRDIMFDLETIAIMMNK